MTLAVLMAFCSAMAGGRGAPFCTLLAFWQFGFAIWKREELRRRTGR